MKDQYGNTINVGDVITYPGRQGSSLWMNTAIVREFGQKPDYWTSSKTQPILKVSVIVRERTFTGRYDENERRVYETTYGTRKTSITCIDRCTIVDVNNLSSDMGRHVIRVLEELQSKGINSSWRV